jgi:hypothetical protein
MLTQNENLFAEAISIEKMESRLELAAAASKVHVEVTIES